MFKAQVIKDPTIRLYGLPSFEAARAAKGPEQPGEAALSPQQAAERLEREAYEKGFASGEAAGLRMGQQKAGLLMERLETVIRELAHVKENAVRELAPQVLRLAVSLSRKIMMEELSLRPEVLVGMVKEAMRKLERTGTVTIKLNPSLQELFLKNKADLAEVHPDIVFDVDSSAAKTGVVVTGAADEVVADIDEQLENLAEQMGDILGLD